MTKTDFLQKRPFVIPGWSFDFVYQEILFGGEVRISNGKHTQVVEVEEISNDYFVIEFWMNRHLADKRIYFKNCELK